MLGSLHAVRAGRPRVILLAVAAALTAAGIAGVLLLAGSRPPGEARAALRAGGGDRWPAERGFETPARLPDLGPAWAPPLEAAGRPIARRLEVGRGDTLMAMLVGAGIPRAEAHEAIQRLRGRFDPRDLRPGQALLVELAPRAEGGVRLASLALDVDFARRLRLERTADGFAVRDMVLPVVRRPRLVTGVVEDSLYVAGRARGVPDRVLMELVRLLSWDVDFQRDLQPGDRFEILWEELERTDGGARRVGEVLYGRLQVAGREIAFYRFERADGRVRYYGPDGRSLRKALLRTPVDGARISSRFGKRRHPILGYTRMHKGVDFAAPRGTPVYAAGDGVVTYAGRKGGYGIYARIRHNGRYATAYAHMSRLARGIRRGVRVRQGQVIGYVGSTGRSTGPHLHFEVLVDGRQVNPLRIRQPSSERLAGRELERFRRTVAAIDALRARLARTDLLASRE